MTHAASQTKNYSAETNPEVFLPQIDDMINLPQADDARISPDGRHVIYSLSCADWEQNERISQLWLAGEGLTEPRQLTYTKTGSWMPRWSPDGQQAAFLSKREGDEAPQIYLFSPFGGEARRLTTLDGSITSFAWSPDGKQIAFLYTVKETDAKKKRVEKFGEYRVDDEDYERAGLWMLTVESKKAERLTGDIPLHINSFQWSPDGQKIVMETHPAPDMKYYNTPSVYLFDLAAHDLKMLVDGRGGSPFWSPDGAQIAYVVTPEPGQVLQNEIGIINADGSGLRIITEAFDEEPMPSVWAPQGIYFAAMQRTGIHLFRIDPSSLEIRQITPADQDGWISFEYTFSRDFTQIAAAAASNDHMVEVVKIDPETGAVTRLTQYDDLTKNWQLGSKEVFRWISQDGTQIEGVLHKPVDFDPARRYPLLVVIHGGPTGISLMGKLEGPELGFYPIEQWLQKGALVLEPNYRGSGGYGEAFQRLNVRNLGVGDYWDVISGVDALIERGWVDPERVGSMGWSQGGYISAFITTYSNRFKAVSVGAGISNWITYYVSTDIHPFTRDYLGANPWDDMEVYQKTSPMTYINSACTPTLIQHGDQDNRVPVPNAFELYQGLLDKGVEARLLIYPGMRHSSRKPRTQRHIMQTNLEWFNKWIWGEQPPEEKSATAYISLVEGISQKETASLPALERYQGSHLHEVYQNARRDQAAFFVFSGEFGLVEPDFPVPADERPLMVDDLTSMTQCVAEKLCDEGIKRVVLHTPPASKSAWVLMYLGCLQAAAGMTGSFTVEHVEYKE